MSACSEKQIEQQLVPDKIWNSMFISIFIANMALNLGQQMSNPLLAAYADSLGAPASQIGILMSMFAITSLLCKIVTSPAMDTYNRKYMVVLSTAILATAYLGYSFSNEMPFLMLFRLLQGCASAFANVCCLALVSEALPANKFGTGMGYYSLAQVISQAIGPTIGLIMVSLFGYSMTYAVNAIVMLVALLLTSRIRYNFKRTKKLSITINNIIAKEAILPASLIFFMGVGFSTINAFLIVYAGKQGIQTGIGLFFTVYALTLLFTRPLIGKLTDKFGLFKVSVPAIIFTGISFFIISFSKSLPLFLVAAFINAFGYGACQPALQSLAMKSVPNERRGSGSSTNYIGQDLGSLVGPTCAGFFAQTIGYTSMWRIMITPLVIGLIILIAFKGKITRIEENFRKKSNVAQ
ncbi:MAG: MFS transporter [Clostridiales bacterium]|nr:MFS transporter [Clostridiales bacterium]